MNETKSSAAARDDLLAKVLALPAADREFIAERIDETLEQETGFSQSPFATPELAQAWADEVERRIDMIDKGLVKPLPADVALREAREYLERPESRASGVVSFTIAPAAQLELIEAAFWYDDIRLGLGTEFLDAIQQGFARVATEPRLHATLEYWTAFQREVRRYCLRRFPYVIVYWIEGHSVTVVAVSHARRRPLYWIDRIPQ